MGRSNPGANTSTLRYGCEKAASSLAEEERESAQKGPEVRWGSCRGEGKWGVRGDWGEKRKVEKTRGGAGGAEGGDRMRACVRAWEGVA
jgi:hypothetical protein